MLTIQTRSPGSEESQISQIYLGERITVPISDIERISADGEELIHIQLSFVNIPIAVNRVTNTWTGDFAKFIAQHF